MFKFVEFSEFSSLSSSSFASSVLNPLRQFYKCLSLAEDSYLGLYEQNTENLRHTFRAAIKQDHILTTDVPNIGSYHEAIKSSAQLEINWQRMQAHQQRKRLIRKIMQPDFLKELIEASDSFPKQKAMLQHLSHMACDTSLSFESFSTAALIALETFIEEIPFLIKHIDQIKNKINTHHPNLLLELNYLKKLSQDLQKIKRDWCENMLDRLEKANAMQNLRYSDNLFKLVSEINHINPCLDFPKTARHDLSPSDFVTSQNIIRRFGSPIQIERLNKLSWNKSDDEFSQLINPIAGIKIAPRTIYYSLITRVNWLWYWLFASYRYRYHFLERYAHLIAQQKLLHDKKFTTIAQTLTTKSIELKQLRSFEQQVQHAYEGLAAESHQEQQSLFRDHAKIELIANYQRSLQKTRELIIMHKMRILSAHTEAFKVYVYVPELKTAESENYTFYKQALTQKFILGLYHEIIEALGSLPSDSLYRLKLRFRPLSLVIEQFYELSAAARIPETTYDPERLCEIAQRPISAFLALPEAELKAELEYYQTAYQKLSSTPGSSSLCMTEHSLYRFMLNYLQFLESKLDSLSDYATKLSMIETYLIKSNPVIADCLSDVQHKRKNTDDPNFKLKLKIRCRSLIAALSAKINPSSEPAPRTRQSLIESIGPQIAANAACFS